MKHIPPKGAGELYDAHELRLAFASSLTSDTSYFGWPTENYGTQPTRLLIGWSHQSTQKTAPETISHETAYDSC